MITIDEEDDLIDMRKEAPLIDKAIKEGLDVTNINEEKTPSLYRYRMDFKIYPFKCPCCKEMITAPPNAVYMNPPFAVGVTKVAYGKKKKKRGEKTQAKLQGTESY